MEVIIRIETENAAFHEEGQTPAGEVARILRVLADKLDAGHDFTATSMKPRDINGNEVGYVATIKEGNEGL